MKSRASKLILAARAWSVLSLAVIALFSFGLGHQGWPGWRGLVSLLLFPGGFVAGLVLAWWKETLGGTLCLGAYLLYGLWRQHLGFGWPSGWALPALATPGLLFLLAPLLARRRNHIRTS